MSKVMFIDDDGMIRKMAGFIMKKCGQQAVTASSGEEGLRLFGSEKPELVFVDMEMPGMDGLETLEKLRQITDAPIYMMSGTVTEELKKRAAELGAGGVIDKPLNAATVSAIVKERCG